jgi:hypothetical protein
MTRVPLFTSYDYSPTIFDRYLDCRHILLLIEVSNISNSLLEKKSCHLLLFVVMLRIAFEARYLPINPTLSPDEFVPLI